MALYKKISRLRTLLKEAHKLISPMRHGRLWLEIKAALDSDCTCGGDERMRSTNCKVHPHKTMTSYCPWGTCLRGQCEHGNDDEMPEPPEEFDTSYNECPCGHYRLDMLTKCWEPVDMETKE